MPEESGKRNRDWVPAEYTGTPGVDRHKVPGTGIEVDRKSRVEIPNRARNRPDQRYELPIAEINSRRMTRAMAETGETLCVRMDEGHVEVVSKNDNRYDVSGPDQDKFCACPDWMRLTLSYPGEDFACKHILIARLQEAAIAPDLLPVGVLWIVEQLGIHYRTVQSLCKAGIIPAAKIKRTWVIQNDDAEAFLTMYRDKMYDPDFRAWLLTIEGVLIEDLKLPIGY